MGWYDERLAAVRRWFANPRFDGITRLHSARDVAEAMNAIARRVAKAAGLAVLAVVIFAVFIVGAVAWQERSDGAHAAEAPEQVPSLDETVAAADSAAAEWLQQGRTVAAHEVPVERFPWGYVFSANETARERLDLNLAGCTEKYHQMLRLGNRIERHPDGGLVRDTAVEAFEPGWLVWSDSAHVNDPSFTVVDDSTGAYFTLHVFETREACEARAGMLN